MAQLFPEKSWISPHLQYISWGVVSPSHDVKSYWETLIIYGGFRKLWYPQIIHFNRVFQYKPSNLGYPYFRKHPYSFQIESYKIWRQQKSQPHSSPWMPRWRINDAVGHGFGVGLVPGRRGGVTQLNAAGGTTTNGPKNTWSLWHQASFRRLLILSELVFHRFWQMFPCYDRKSQAMPWLNTAEKSSMIPRNLTTVL